MLVLLVASLGAGDTEKKQGTFWVLSPVGEPLTISLTGLTVWSKPTQFSSTMRRAFWKASSKERPMPMTSPGGTWCEDWGPGGTGDAHNVGSSGRIVKSLGGFSSPQWWDLHCFIENLTLAAFSPYHFHVDIGTITEAQSLMVIHLFGFLYSHSEDVIWDLAHPLQLFKKSG